MLQLYFAPGASSMAPHIMLHEVGAPFEAHPISLGKKENRAPAYLAVNPEGKVPTLLIEGRRLTEVAGILYYLARCYPETKLWPAGDIDAEAQAISWMSFIAATVHPARGRGGDYAMSIFALADQRLAAGRWALGEAYSIADIHLFRLYWRFVNAAKPPKGSFPHLEAHHDRMMARPAVKRTLDAEAAIGYELP